MRLQSDRLRGFIVHRASAPPWRRAQTLDKSSHCAGRRLRSRSLNQLHNRAADHRGIRELRHLRDVFRVGDAEPHGYRQPGPSPDTRHQRRRVRGQALLFAGNPHARNGVNKSFAVRRDGLKPLVGTGGRGQKNRRKLHALHLGQVLAGLFDNQVDHQHAVRAGRGRIVGKLV